MKYKEKYKHEKIGEFIKDTLILKCDISKPCLVCKELTNFVNLSHARLCSDECCEKFWNAYQDKEEEKTIMLSEEDKINLANDIAIIKMRNAEPKITIDRNDLIKLFSEWNGYISDSCWEDTEHQIELDYMMKKYDILKKELLG